MDVTVNIEGGKELEEALLNLGPKLAKAALRQALNAAAQPMIDAAKARTPVLTGGLRDSIGVQVKLNKKGQSATALIGPDAKRFYGRFVEFGTKHQGREPFLRPAFDSAGKDSLEKFTEVLQAALPVLEAKK